jgi:Flp pilus assembly protein TadB
MILAWLLATMAVVLCIVVGRVVVRPLALRRRVLRRLTVLSSASGKKSPALRRIRVSRLWFRRLPTQTTEEHLALLLDSVARELRLGASVNAAVLTALRRKPGSPLSCLEQPARDGESLHAVISRRLGVSRPRERKPWRRRSESYESTQFAARAIATAANGGDPVHAVESAARTLRSNAAIVADSRAAVAYTKTSMNVLTWIPLVIAGWLVLRDQSIRDFFVSTFGTWCLAIGISLNVLGRYLVRRMTSAATRVDSAVSDFVDIMAVHLRAGTPPATAFRTASEGITGTFAECAQLVIAAHDSGARFIDALESQRERFPLRAQQLIDALIDTERDGLSTRELFDRLATDAHAQRRRDAEQRIRSLPVRLTLPLVGCILPAYALIAVVPLIASQLTSVTYDPHPLTGGTP